MTTIAIIGAGPLGRWLALAAARAGFRVFLEDVMPSNLHHAQEYIRQELSPERLSEAGRDVAGRDVESRDAAGRNEAGRDKVGRGFSPGNHAAGDGGGVAPEVIRFVSTVEDAVREADLVIDCVPDELESKLEILWLLDRMAPPRTVIATPTTNLSIDDLASCTYRPEKCIAIAASPRTLSDERPGSAIKLVTASRTTPETINLVTSFWERLGFLPEVEERALGIRH
jgi:3-hydroxybutyryl-CoA dehydrogenase